MHRVYITRRRESRACSRFRWNRCLPTPRWMDRAFYVQLPMDDKLPSPCLCNIHTQTQRIRNADLIVWDELPMTHRYCVEALERYLRGIIRQNKLLGGKTMLFPGDWRHIGPISEADIPIDVVDIAFISSPLWKHVNKFRLTQSRRDKQDPPYANFVQDIRRKQN